MVEQIKVTKTRSQNIKSSDSFILSVSFYMQKHNIRI